MQCCKQQNVMLFNTVLQLLIDELQLHGQITAEEFLKQREEQLDKLFPTAELMPGADQDNTELRQTPR